MKCLLFVLLAVCPVLVVSAENTIQINVSPILNGRSVTTLTKGRLVPWTKGIDGGGRADGYLTHEAAIFNGDNGLNALPGDGCFPANGSHPEVRLHFSNSDGVNNQTLGVAGEGEFTLTVPTSTYTRIYLFLSSAEGPSHLTVRMEFVDGSSDERAIVLPDYYNDASADTPRIFSLAANLAKWNAAGRMAEPDHHFLHGIELRPDEQKKLVRIHVHKSAPAYLVFWGATGVTKD